MKRFILFFLLLNVSMMSASWSLETKKAPNPEAEATYADIKKTLGSVPTFLKDFPEDAISGAWLEMKGIQLNPSSAIPPKYKELIGLAVSAQIPCRFCNYFHRSAAKLYNASQQELDESIAIAASTRKWSAYFYGTDMNMGQFRKDVDKMLKFAGKQQKNLQAMEVAPSATDISINTPEDVYKDVKNHFGFVPAFVKTYPQAGVVGAWKEFKAIELNALTEIPGKYKDLIALAVASQTPCQFCTYYNTQSALMQGASQEEINEAVAMAGVTRHWSTVLNGQVTDEKKFKSEADRIMKFVKSNMNKQVGLRY